MNKAKLKKEEKEILKDFDEGKFKQIENFDKEKRKYQDYAKFTTAKSMTINIRISAKDMQKIRAIAAEKGLPYQTFITSVLHQYSKTEKPGNK